MLKRAMMAGLNAAGVNVDDLEVASVPVTRFLVAASDAVAGVTVRLAPDDPQSVVIRFFDNEGIDITEDTQRKIERLLPPRGLPAGAGPARSATSASRPGPSSTTPPP